MGMECGNSTTHSHASGGRTDRDRAVTDRGLAGTSIVSKVISGESALGCRRVGRPWQRTPRSDAGTYRREVVY